MTVSRQHAAAVQRLTAALEATVDDLVSVPMDQLSSEDLDQLVRLLARTETRLAGVTARAVAAAERTGVVTAAGAASGRAWLAAATGATPRAAGRTAALAHAMDSSPALAAAVASGDVVREQAQSIAAAVGRGTLPATSADGLVEVARTTSAGALATEVRRREARADQELLRRDEQWARQRRRLRRWRRDDGSVEGAFLLDPVVGELLDTGIDAFTTPDPAGTPPDLRRSPEQRAADALQALVAAALGGGAPGRKAAVRPHVTVVVPVEALAPDLDTAVAAAAVGETGGGSTVSTQAVRTILCDATVRRLVVDPAGRPLDVGRATRTWSGAQRAAARAVDGGCRGPACDRPFAWTDLHHLQWWSKRGRTSLDNGVPLCPFCHDLVHGDGWRLVLDPSTRVVTWTSPTGVVTTTLPRGPAAAPALGSTPLLTGDRQDVRPTPGTVAGAGAARASPWTTAPLSLDVVGERVSPPYDSREQARPSAVRRRGPPFVRRSEGTLRGRDRPRRDIRAIPASWVATWGRAPGSWCPVRRACAVRRGGPARRPVPGPVSSSRYRRGSALGRLSSAWPRRRNATAAASGSSVSRSWS